jgi:peptidoglycan/LPS O-acetylase OafA/YrhL
VAAAYVVAMAVYVYAIVDPAVTFGSDARAAAVGVGLLAVHVATGWAIGRWWAVLLPALAVPVAVPAGYPDRGEPELWVPIAFVVAPLGVCVIGVAVAARRLRQ